MKRFTLWLILCTSLFVSGSSAHAALKATNVSFLLSQVRTSTTSLVAGKVYFYAPGTTTLKTIWLDRDKGSTANNPYTLDANGTAQVYADGLYRVVIKDAAGVTKYDRDNLAFQDALTSGIELVASDYGTDLSTAVAAIGSTPASLVVNTAQTVNGNTTVPATLQLRVVAPGLLTIASGKTLTIAGLSENLTTAGAGNLVVNGHMNGTPSLLNTGTVTFGTGAIPVLPVEWLGAGTGGDDGLIITKAIAATADTGTPVQLRSYEYNIVTGITTAANKAFILQGVSRDANQSNGSILKAASSSINILTVSSYAAQIRNVVFIGNGTGTGHGLVINNGATLVNDTTIKECWFTAIPNTALYIYSASGLNITDNYFENSQYGIYSKTVVPNAVAFADNIISHNRFYALTKSGIYIDGGAYGNSSVNNYNIISNNIFDIIGATTDDTGALMLMDSANSTVVMGNQFNTNRANDIVVKGSVKVNLIGNNHARTGKRAYLFDDATLDTVVGASISSANYLSGTHGLSLPAIEAKNTSNVTVTDSNISSWSGETRITYGIYAESGSAVKEHNNSISEVSTAASNQGGLSQWSPVIYGASTAGTNTYSVQSGSYRRIGDIVYYQIKVTMTAKDAAMSGAIRVSLPFTSANVAGNVAPGYLLTENVTLASGKKIVAAVNPNTNYVALFLEDTSTTPAGLALTSESNINATTAFYISGWTFL